MLDKRFLGNLNDLRQTAVQIDLHPRIFLRRSFGMSNVAAQGLILAVSD